MTDETNERALDVLASIDTQGLIGRRDLLRRASLFGAVATLGGFTGVLSACSSSGGGNGSGGSSTITVGIDSGAYTPVLKAFAPEMKKATGVDVKLVSYPLEHMYDQNLLALRQPQGRYDAFDFWPNYVGDFGPFLMPLDEAGDVADLNLGDIAPGFQLLNRYGGKQVGVTMDGDMFIGTYRTDLFEKQSEQEAFQKRYGYKLAPPATFAQYKDTAEFFTRPGENLYGAVEVTNYFVYGFFLNHLVQLASSKGQNYGELFDANMKPLVTGDLVVEALTNYVNMKKYMPPQIAANLPWDKGREVFFSGQIAQANWWTDMPKGAADPKTSKVSGKIKCAPSWGDVTMLPYGRAMGIPKNSRNASASFKALVFIQQSRNADKWVAETFSQSLIDPWRMSMFKNPKSTFPLQAESGFADNFASISKQLLERKKVFPDLAIPGMAKYLDSIVRHVSEALTEQKSVTAALGAMATEFESITDGIGRDQQVKQYQEYRSLMTGNGYWT